MKALYFTKENDATVRCSLCPHRCRIPDGATGRCGARRNHGGELFAESYAKISALALDSIEKKPLACFRPGSLVLSAGSYGCNMHCQFCQNHSISAQRPPTVLIPPSALVENAAAIFDKGNIGIAFTYNEPLISYEYVLDTARLAKKELLSTVLVTNGFVCEEPLMELLPHIDALNIDLKAFNDYTYAVLGGGLEDVKRTIQLAAAKCHVEVTTLIVPGMNDSAEEMDALAEWLAKVDKGIPLHVSRFFPFYKMEDFEATDISLVRSLTNIARGHLRYVYTGNC